MSEHSEKHGHSHKHETAARVLQSSSRVLEPPPAELKPILEWQHVSLEFAGRQVLHDLTAWVCAGELTCLCGSNGAGKTQMIRLGLGFMRAPVGKIILLGGEPSKTRHNVGYVPQLKAFNRSFPATVEDVLVAAIRGAWPLFRRVGERDRAAAALQRVGGLTLLDKDISVLSGGELQRVFVARALLQDPLLLVLDEPLAAIDTKGRAQLMDLMGELKADKKITILLITHSELVVRSLADRVIFLDKGHLVGWGETSRMLAIDELRDVAFIGHDHESAIHGDEG
jgi:zinc transport system ATP-binding protein